MRAIFLFFLFLSPLFPQQLTWNHTEVTMAGTIADIALKSKGEELC
jgi:hypothetical protein